MPRAASFFRSQRRIREAFARSGLTAGGCERMDALAPIPAVGGTEMERQGSTLSSAGGRLCDRGVCPFPVITVASICRGGGVTAGVDAVLWAISTVRSASL